MKYDNIIKKIKLSAALLVVVCQFTGCRSKKETFRDSNVVVETQLPSFWFINPHGNSMKILTAGGHTFKGIRGSEPYYLLMPGNDSILFVTDYPQGTTTFHILDIKTHIETAINGNKSLIGNWIGSARKPGEKYSIYVERDVGQLVRIVEQEDHWKEIIILNLATNSIESQIEEPIGTEK